MTTLAIIPDYENKRLEFSGTVAAGEHVAVSIVGGSEWAGTGSALRLRVLFGGKMVAVFPYWTDENEDDWPDEVVSADAWDTTGDDPTCTLVLNTIQAEKMLRRGGECLWILDDTENHTLYGMGLCHVEPWPKNLPSDVPYNLDGYPDFVKDAKQAILGAQAAISEAVDDANGIVAYVTAAKNSAQAAATNAGAFKDQAETAASNAGDFKTLAETAKTGAEAAQTAAETAQGKAEDAQAAAEAVLAAVENKADKVEDATEGNFAALDDEGNLVDSGKNAEDFAASEHSHAMSEVTGLSEALDAKGSAETLTNVVNKVATLIGSAAGDDTRSVREIAALMIAALVADADARYDTLKEIADWIQNDTTSAAKMANDIEDLKSEKADAADLAAVATSGSYNDLSDKPTIPAPVDISGKLNGTAAYSAWNQPTEYDIGKIVSYKGRIYRCKNEGNQGIPPDGELGPNVWDDVTIGALLDEKQNALSSAQLAAVNSGATAAKVATWDGYAAQIAAKANTADVNSALAQKASLTDLPYALVTPGEWEFSPSSYDGREFSIVEQAGSEVGTESYLLFLGEEQVGGIIDGEPNELGLVFEAHSVADPDNQLTVTATRASLPGHLLDRAGNRVVVSGDTTLTLPAAIPGYIRDFLVRLEISGSTVPTITFAAPTGETITYETDGDEFPVPDEAGTWSCSFTENCVAHKFAVSLKKVNVVTQGGL